MNDHREPVNGPETPSNDADRELIELLRAEARDFCDPLLSEDQRKRVDESVKLRAQAQETSPAESGDVRTGAADRNSWIPSVPNWQLIGLAAAVVLILAGAGWWFAVRTESLPTRMLLVAHARPVYTESRGSAPGDPVHEMRPGEFELAPDREWMMSVLSPRDGSLIVVRIAQNEISVWPRPEQPAITVAASRETRYGPFDFLSDRVIVLVIVTETNSVRAVSKALAQPPATVDVEAAKARILSQLWADGHRWAAMDAVTVFPKKNQTESDAVR